MTTRAEKPPIMLRRMRGMPALTGASEFDRQVILQLPPDKVLRIPYPTVPRSEPATRWYWALVGLVVANLDGDVSKDQVHDLLKMRVGLTRRVKTRTGEIELPRSITELDDEEFRVYLERVKDFVVTTILPGVGSAALEAEVNAMLDGSKS